MIFAFIYKWAKDIYRQKMYWEAKKHERRRYCERKRIDLHIDDTEIYGKYFTTKFVLYKNGLIHHNGYSAELNYSVIQTLVACRQDGI